MIRGKVVKHRAHPVGHRHAGPLVLPEVAADRTADLALLAVVRMEMPGKSYFCLKRNYNDIYLMDIRLVRSRSQAVQYTRSGERERKKPSSRSLSSEGQEWAAFISSISSIIHPEK